ncbi:MAG: XRE family transcriptional regulator [Acidobacteria bacterium]|nr:XRE family transcriptional regulator [Acidobacteriota bacterium]
MTIRKKKSAQASHVTKGDVLDDLGLSRAEALEAKVKADLWKDLVSHIESLHLSQKELAGRLGIHQPDVSNLLTGKISRFSAGMLIHYAVKLELGVQVKLTAAKTRKGHTIQASIPPRQKSRSLAA